MDPPNVHLLLLLVFASTINAQFPAYCGSTGNFTADSTYQTTLTTLLSSLSTTNYLSFSYSFFNASAPVSGDFETLYIFGLCRGDFTAEDCQACLVDIASDMRRLCPLQKEALLYKGNCIIRYSNASFFGAVATEPMYVAGAPANFSDTFDAVMRKLLSSLGAEAAGGSSLKKYASRNESAGADLVNMFMQCTPDLTEQQCSNCLGTGVQTIRDCCASYAGGRVMVPSCLILWGTYHNFFNSVSQPIPPAPLPSPAATPTLPSYEANVLPPPPGNISKLLSVVIAVVVPTVLLVMVIVSVFCLIRRRRRKVSSENAARQPTVAPVDLKFESQGAATSTPARPTNLTYASGGEMSTPSVDGSSSLSTNEAQDGSTRTVSWLINDM